MPERLTVLYLPHASPKLHVPWDADVTSAIGDRHEFRVLDKSKPIAPQFKGVDAIIDMGGSVGTREMVDAAMSCRLWQILGTGTDHFDLIYWRSKNMPVSNCPGPFSAVALADCAMMFILMLARQYTVARENLEKLELYGPMGMELEGLKLAIVGFGASGTELARRAIGHGMKILAIDVREVSPAEQSEYGLEFVGKPDALDMLLPTMDVVSLHLHLNAETHHHMNAQRLARMKPTAFLINVARGALVDEAALTEALLAQRIGGAGLDAFGTEPPDLSSPLFRLPNVVATPHIAGATDGTSRKRARCAADNVDRIAAGLEPLYRVA